MKQLKTRSSSQAQRLIVATVSVTLDPNGPAISPLIYGVNNEHSPARLQQLGATVNRLGGTPWSSLNGPLRAINAGDDYYFHNYDSIDNIPVDPAGFHQRTSGVGGTTMLTAPLLERVAKDTSSYAFSVRKYGPQAHVLDGDAGDGVKTDGSFVVGNDPSDAYTANTPALVESWLRSLPSGIPLFGLDNEPMLWHTSHRAAHPEGARMQEVITATKAYAAKIRAVFPSAALLGPEEWNYEGCFYSGYDAKRAESLGYNASRYPDRQANGGQDWLTVYVKALSDHFTKTGQRLLDYLSVHFYPHTPSGEALSDNDDTSPALHTLRLRSTRSLWDPSYISEDYLKDFGAPNHILRLIPRLKQWAGLFPGTKTALTEYSFGPDHLLGAALAQVEALGIFGREGLELACRWPSPSPTSLVGAAFRLFRNFDGKGGAFGSLRQTSVISGPLKEVLSSYAALSQDRKKLTVLVVNRGMQEEPYTSIELKGLSQRPVQLYQLTAAGLSRPPDSALTTRGNLALTLPPSSATLLVVAL